MGRGGADRRPGWAVGPSRPGSGPDHQPDDWDGAQALIEDAYQDWETHDFYLHVTLRHTDIDAVRSSFHEAIAYLSSREDSGECAAVCARLVNQLELILEGELPTLKNLL